MSSLDKAIIAYYEKNGKRFEVYVDAEKTYAYLEKRKKDLNNILVAEEIYSDARKGERAKTSDMEEVFGTTDIYKILEKILNEGEVQLTTEQRRKKTEEKRKQIVAIIAKEAIDPRTKAPHPLPRIEAAMQQAKIHIDPFKDPRAQIEEVVKALRPILPMKFEKIKLAIKIPAQHAYKCYPVLKSFGVKQEEWTSSGDLMAVIELFAGMKGEFYDKIGKASNGEALIKEIQ